MSHHRRVLWLVFMTGTAAFWALVIVSSICKAKVSIFLCKDRRVGDVLAMSPSGGETRGVNWVQSASDQLYRLRVIEMLKLGSETVSLVTIAVWSKK